MGMFKLYIDYFKEKLIRLWRKPQETVSDFEEITEELWAEDFSKPEKCRFQEETGNGYTASFSTSNKQIGTAPAFTVTVLRKHLYAWAVNHIYRYKDFILEAEMVFPKRLSENGRQHDAASLHTDVQAGDTASHSVSDMDTAEANVSGTVTAADGVLSIDTTDEALSAGSYAAGFLFRYISEYAFYALAVSDNGWLRLDAVVNSTPIPLLGWTKLPETAAQKEETNRRVALTLIANNTAITILVNGLWIASCEDDTIQAAGKIAFAVQNWGKTARAAADLTAYRLNSLPFAVETAHTAANTDSAVPPAQRLHLAQSWYAMGKYIPALLQIQAIWKIRPPEPEERLLAGRIYAAQHLMAEAEKELCAVIAACPQHESAYAELGGLYYQSGANDKLHTLIAAVPELVCRSAFLSNLAGHSLHEQQRYEEAAAAYRQAFTLQPEQGVFALNEARDLSACGKTEAAATAYRQAAGVFLQQQAYQDALSAVTALERLAPHDSRTQSLAAKLWYALEDYPRARTLLQTLCENGSTDSADWYLYGLLLRHNTESAGAITAAEAFEKACMLEPDCALYIFRLAETVFLSGGKYRPILEKALAADPKNGWIHNLAALAALQENRLADAEAAVTKARALLPLELPPLANYLEILRRKKQLAACFSLFEPENDRIDAAVEHAPAAAYRLLANVLHSDGYFEEAAEWYRRAVKLEPRNAPLLTDKAENDRALYLLNEADDTLIKALDIEPSPRIYQLIAALAVQKGDYLRAEVTLRTALEQFNSDAGLYYDLLCLYHLLRRFDTVQPLLERLKKLEQSERVTALERELAAFIA